METSLYSRVSIFFALTLMLSSCRKNLPSFCDCKPEDVVGTASVFSTGFNNPRGLKFGPDGYLYVAEAGIGGMDSSMGCAQVIPPVGPYRGSPTGARISRVNWDGVRTTYVDSLPSSINALGDILGVADVSFFNNTLYALLAGAGCSHGVPSIPNGVIKINPDRSWKTFADLSAFQMSHPVKAPEEEDFEPDGTWYSMVTVGGDLFAIEPNHGELDRISRSGDVRRVVDISASQGHVVPTAMVFHNGFFYVGNLDVFPITGKSKIYKISMAGDIHIVDTGFSTILGIAIDKAGALYVLENTTGNPFPTPGTGDIIRLDPRGGRKAIVTGLNLPTAMTFGPDEKLYVSNWGFGKGPGGGEVLQIDITCSNNHQSKNK
ncbi:ScyD/ScyE family protein [Flavitalea sp. BT771]|uniref:ScyD/ScyE family protein n=1 Tax=Flavitalea sp. BT771 TaxID=3063329 RepID=UPI0026E1A4BF|nr:ScyD/ScyE family protein [Flavitalea sp. BT771]MDO6430081.1 ScyD/ScyE family protein [Flavitalea sp. BT771]MDV6219780.1 ScyD/ScyE family protein [Flavitalea sp. BT771]